MGRPTKGTHVLARVRERIGWYQKEMWDRTKIPIRTIQDIERGTLKLSPANARKISAVTGVSTDYLLVNDPNREIANTSGEPWSEKDIQTIKQRNKDLPLGEEWIRYANAQFCDQMLLDYFELRCLLKATPNPFAALDLWRKHREKAWLEFQKECPTAKVKEEAIDIEAVIKNQGRPIKNTIPERFEIIKQDLELARELYPLRYAPEAEHEAFRNFLFAGVRSGDKMLDASIEILNSMQPVERPETFWGRPDPGPLKNRRRRSTKPTSDQSVGQTEK